MVFLKIDKGVNCMCLELTSKIQKIGATKLGLTSSELLIFLFLVSHGNQDLNNIYPSKARISDLCAISVRNIAYINKSLEEKGFIKVLVSSCGKKNNTYTIYRNRIDEVYNLYFYPKPILHGGMQPLHGGGATIAPEQIMKHIINKTTYSTMNDIDPIGSSGSAKPVVVVSNNDLEQELKPIREQLTKWNVSSIDDLCSKHTVDELDRAIRITVDSAPKVNNFAAFFIKALKSGWINTLKTNPGASEGNNIEIVDERTTIQFKVAVQSKIRDFISKYNFDKNTENLEKIKNWYNATEKKYWHLLEKDIVEKLKAEIIPEDPILVEKRRLEKEKALAEIKSIARISPVGRSFANLVGSF